MVVGVSKRTKKKKLTHYLVFVVRVGLCHVSTLQAVAHGCGHHLVGGRQGTHHHVSGLWQWALLGVVVYILKKKLTFSG